MHATYIFYFQNDECFSTSTISSSLSNGQRNGTCFTTQGDFNVFIFFYSIIQEILSICNFLDREIYVNWGNNQQILSMRISQLLIQEFIKYSSQWKVSLIAQKIVTIAFRE